MNVLEKILEEIENLNYYPDGMGCGIEDRGITDRYEACEYGWNEAIEAVVEAINNIEEAESSCGNGGWIPYTLKNIPDKEDLYLVTCDDEDYPVKRMRFKKEDGYGLWYDDNGIYDGVIFAWQPLPEPYKGGKE